MTKTLLLSFAAPAVFALMTGCSSDRNRTAYQSTPTDQTGTTGTAERSADRTNTTDKATTSDRMRGDIDDYVNKMNTKIDDLKARMDQRTKDIGTKGNADWDRIKTRLDDLRKDVSDLKNENANNWWDHAKARIDREWDDLNKDFKHMTKSTPARAQR